MVVIFTVQQECFAHIAPGNPGFCPRFAVNLVELVNHAFAFFSALVQYFGIGRVNNLLLGTATFIVDRPKYRNVANSPDVSVQNQPGFIMLSFHLSIRKSIIVRFS
jgi:hypothetical protein